MRVRQSPLLLVALLSVVGAAYAVLRPRPPAAVDRSQGVRVRAELNPASA